MARKTSPLLPSSLSLLNRLGARLQLARLRRGLTAKQVAERAGMSPMTLRSLERGGSGVTLGACVAVLQVLGLEKDLDLLAAADTLGRELQDARLPRRAPHALAPGWSHSGRPEGSPARVSSPEMAAEDSKGAPGAIREKPRRQSSRKAIARKASSRPLAPLPSPPSWISEGGFVRSADLVELLRSDRSAGKGAREGD